MPPHEGYKKSPRRPSTYRPDLIRRELTRSRVSGPAWVDTREAADLLGVTPADVAALVAAGRLIRHEPRGTLPHYSRREVLALDALIREETRR